MFTNFKISTACLLSAVMLCLVITTGCKDEPTETTDPAKQPDAKQPDTKTPDTKTPDAKTPDVKQPDAKQPDTKEPTTTDNTDVNDGLIEITIDMPNPQFTGTPKDLKKLKVNVDTQNPESKRPPLRAPEGVVLLSRDKEVTGSDDLPMIGELEQITDGDKEAADGSYVELAPEPQWVQIDLEQSAELWGIVIWHYHSSARVYRDVIVQLADDADFTQNVRTIFNNDYDNSSGKGVGKDYEYFDEYVGKLFRVKGEKAQYIRCYSNGNTDNDQNNYIEIEIYGKPAK